jgi:hypothetical protein
MSAAAFKARVATGAPTDLSNDRWLLKTLNRLSADAITISEPAR